MKRETWEKYQKNMEEVQETARETAEELKAAEAAGGGLGGAALFAARLERDAEALREFSEKQKAQ